MSVCCSKMLIFVGNGVSALLFIGDGVSSIFIVTSCYLRISFYSSQEGRRFSPSACQIKFHPEILFSNFRLFWLSNSFLFSSDSFSFHCHKLLEAFFCQKNSVLVHLKKIFLSSSGTLLKTEIVSLSQRGITAGWLKRISSYLGHYSYIP